MRTVTAYPPAALAAPRMTPRKPMSFSRPVSAWPRTTMAPTTTTPWMKLEPDIKGVWRITGTRVMSS